MRVRHPPGRAGRPWLVHRLAVARRGAGVLDEKQRALLRERRRLEPVAERAARRWGECAVEAERALIRALVLGGERQLEAAAGGPPPAAVTARWRTTLGVACPEEMAVAVHADPNLSARGGSAALLAAAEAHRRALEAAANVAVAEGALRRIDRELRMTLLRRNAIERRWIPAHEEALATLELALEEGEREDGVRVRWVAGDDTTRARD